MSELVEEEKQILEAFDSGTLKRAAHAADTQNRHRAYAEAIYKHVSIQDDQEAASQSSSATGSVGALYSTTLPFNFSNGDR